MKPNATYGAYMSTSTDHSPSLSGMQQKVGGRSKALAKTVKLSADLVALAEMETSVAQRSTPKQIEYWSLLGRVVERYLTKDQTHALLAEQKAISHITLDDIFPSADVVMGNLEESRASGELAASVTFADESFEAVDGEDDVFRKIRADGSKVLGTLKNGEFVERH